MDFIEIKERTNKNGTLEIYPNFRVKKSKDLMIRGKSFYAIWDEKNGMWSTDEYDVQRLIDSELWEYSKKRKEGFGGSIHILTLGDFSSNMWTEFQSYVKNLSDSLKVLDEQLTFKNTEVKQSDYVSKRLNYSLEGDSYGNYDEIIGTLYDEDERDKLEWAIGSVISGDSKSIQKFLVLYGEAGTGKSTILNIIQKLFEGYYTTFDAKALTGSNNTFSTEAFKSNPLVAIQHDGDLSKIEDNTKLNSIVSHETMSVRELYKPSYMTRYNCFLFMGTNKPVKITDAKSGIIRRLIDVKPSGRKIPPKRYQYLISQIDFELGAIALHCLDVYRTLGKNYYEGYRPIDMMMQTDVFFNFVEANFSVFKEQNGATLSQAYDIYKNYCDESLIDFKLPRHKFREEFKNYFKRFYDMTRLPDGKQVRSYYEEFLTDKFSIVHEEKKEEKPSSLVLDCTDSIFDKEYCDCQAQYTTLKETPLKKWIEVNTKLSDINTNELHYVRPPINHIVIDFDLKNETGEKSLEKNIEAASQWPATYSELSKSGKGIHLHYIYTGDVETLSRLYDKDIEIKVFTGNLPLRRKLTKCNNIPINKISSGLPLKGVKMVSFTAVANEKALRRLLEKNLKKEYHPGTKSSVDFIYKILEDSFNSKLCYDVTDMRPKILAFANNSTHNSDYCVKLVTQMKFKSEEYSLAVEKYEDDTMVFYDVEVFPNLFIICWKPDGKDKVYMINPSPQEVERLMRMKLVGFNCRRYDNHILYARHLGYTNEQLYQLSQRIINESKNCMFGEAYNISYTDIFDFSSKKQSLKKFEIELGIHHQELGLPWDKPVPEELWQTVADYCGNDVDATEATFHARKEDWVARKILARLSGLSVNDTTQKHTARIIFGKDKNPQSQFVYTDLSIMFPGYKFENGKSYYRGELVGEGGYVYAKPGMYGNVALLDVASMHPNSAILLNIFGPYTQRFVELVEGRIAVKHEDKESYEKLLGGVLLEVIQEFSDISEDDLAYGLKIAINIVYGLTSAKFDNPFKDPRNIDNIVAKRGALFMIDLKHAVLEKGFEVAHIKTDSIKIPDATPEIIEFVMEFGKKYGYDFEHEATYDKICLVNDAVYIAKYDDKGIRTKKGKHANEWTATGAQFAQPYLFKTLFSKEEIEFKDMCETKTVQGALYLDMNERLSEDEHDYHFVGKAGCFCPIKPDCGGGQLLRLQNQKYYSATGAKGYRWLEAEVVKFLNKESDIDLSFYQSMIDEAIKAIDNYGFFGWFSSDEKYEKGNNGILPF